MTGNTFRRMLFAAALVFSLALHAQDYPAKPVRIIVPNPAGGGADLLARTGAQATGIHR